MQMKLDTALAVFNQTSRQFLVLLGSAGVLAQRQRAFQFAADSSSGCGAVTSFCSISW